MTKAYEICLDIGINSIDLCGFFYLAGLAICLTLIGLIFHLNRKKTDSGGANGK